MYHSLSYIVWQKLDINNLVYEIRKIWHNKYCMCPTDLNNVITMALKCRTPAPDRSYTVSMALKIAGCHAIHKLELRTSNATGTVRSYYQLCWCTDTPFQSFCHWPTASFRALCWHSAHVSISHLPSSFVIISCACFYYTNVHSMSNTSVIQGNVQSNNKLNTNKMVVESSATHNTKTNKNKIIMLFLQGISITKSLGTFWRFGSRIVTRPVAVNVSTMQCIRSIISALHNVLPRCRGNTTFASAAVRRRHSKMTPGRAWSGRSFSRTSFAVLQTGFARLMKHHKT